MLDQTIQIELKNSGATLIYLRIDVDTAAKRVGFNTARPLLNVNPRMQWSELMKNRKSIYEDLAQITIDNNSATLEDVVNEIQIQIGHLRSR